nr:MAG TPA: vacuolar protein sorting-associated protein [Caudoviricetes sp.]
MNFLSLAKTFLPQNSPWLQRIEQVQQIAAQFSPTKSGLSDVMRQYNIGQERLQQAIGALNNPMISGVLNRVRPGLVDQLKGVAQEAAADPKVDPAPGQGSSSKDAVADLRARLEKLK